MKKVVFLFAAMLLAAAGASAKSVVFTLSNNTKVYYLLGGETAPMLRFVDGRVTVNDDVYSISGIKNFYISETDDPNAIEQTLAQQNISYGSNTLVVKAAEGTNVKVYAADGRAVEADILQNGDATTIDLNRLDRGIYMIQIGTSSMKVLKK